MMKDIREYRDYRAYLFACYEVEKATSKASVSMKLYAERIGLSDSSFRMILAGKRNLTNSNILVIAKALKLTQPQTELFEGLVLRDQAATLSEQQYYEKKLKKINKKNKLRSIRSSEKFIVSDTFIPTLLVYLMDNQHLTENFADSDIAVISKKLGVDPRKLKLATIKLKENGVLTTTSSQSHIIFDKIMSENDRTKYLHQVFLEAAGQLKDPVVKGRPLYSVKTFSINPQKIREFGNEYKLLLEKYMTNASTEDDLHIVRAAFCLTHLTTDI